MRIPKSAARKRRLAVLRQVSSIAGEDLARPVGVQHVDERQETPRFDVACQANLPLRLVVRDERTGESDEVLIEQPFLVIGSNELCDIHLRHAEVSQRHAYLQILDGRLLGCDLSSRTGTHWGNEIRSRNWLKPGESMFIGPYSIQLADNDFSGGPGPAAASASSTPSTSAEETPIVRLNFLNALSRTGQSRVSRIKRRVTLVGWSQLCNLRLQHPTVGRVHCSLIWTPQGMWVVDLLCRGGTRINGELVRSGLLEKGDELGVGEFRFQVEYGAGDGSVELLPSDSSAKNPVTESPSPNVSAPASGSQLSIVPDSRIALSSGASLPGQAVAGSPLAGGQPLSMAFPQLTAIAGQFPQGAGLPAQSVADSVALALMQQFSLMQQQLFDHTQQLLTVMAQAFSNAHSRQLELIKGELNRVHELNSELQRLNIQRAGTPAGGEPPQQPAADKPADAVGEENRSADQPQPQSPASRSSHLPVARDRARRAGRHERKSHVFSPESAALNAAATTEAGPEPLNDAAIDRPAVVALPAASSETPAEPRDAIEPATGDVHAWLSGRINKLEQERSSRWKKILQLLTPGSGG